MKFFSWKALTTGLAALLLPVVASAQSSLFGEIPASDVSVKQFLSQLFGTLVGGEGGANPIAELLSTFNAGMLVVAGVLVFYTLVAGVLQTAQDGEMMGRRWSSIWIPIRTTLGAAAIMPSLSGGYCVIQAVVIWLALQGVGMANTMWGAFLGSGGSNVIDEAFYAPPGASRQIRETFNDMFMSNVCTEAFRKSQGFVADLPMVGFTPIAAEAKSVTLGNFSGYNYGPGGTMCGKVYMMTGLNAGAGSTVGVGMEGPAASSSLVNSSDIAEALRPVHQSNMTSAQSQLQQFASKVVNDNNMTAEQAQQQYNSLLNSLVQNYTTQLKETAHATYMSQRSAIQTRVVEGMKRDGWAMAGVYYMAIVRAQDEITRAITQTPASASGELWGTGSAATDLMTTGGMGAMMNAAVNTFVNSGERKASLDRARGLVKASNSGATSQVEAIADDAAGRSWVMKVVSWFMNDDMSFLGNSQFAQQGQNPIIMAKNLGENMTAGAWTALAIGGTVLALSGVDVLGTGIGDWATVFTPVLFALFGMFVVPGATLSTYVPMIPYILWIGVVIGWIILVVEAVIAAPIWAVAHIAPDGDGVVGRGGQGYMLVLSLMLRPPLMIMGLACSIALMKPIGYFINSTFLGAFAIGVNPGPFALTQAIAGCVLYTIVMISVVHRVFALIHVVPDRILRWIGGGGNELGEEARSVEGMSASKAVAALGATQQIGNLTQGTLQGARDLGRKKADKANAEAIRAEEQKSRMAQEEGNYGDNAYRSGRDAQNASARAEEKPNDLQARNNASQANQLGRDARLSEAENKLDHYMKNSGEGGLKGGLEGLRQQPMEAREQLASNLEGSNPQAAQAVRFANNLDQARDSQQQNPDGSSMQRFLNNNAASVRTGGSSARSWEVAAAQAAPLEAERIKWSKPPEPPSGGGGNSPD